jgi:hypothetical protein
VFFRITSKGIIRPFGEVIAARRSASKICAPRRLKMNALTLCSTLIDRDLGGFANRVAQSVTELLAEN